MKCSVIFPVLESYEVVRRQIRWMERIFPKDWEAVIVDDGSMPPIVFCGRTTLNLKIVYSLNFSPWGQAPATNLGASVAEGDYIWGCAIDHMVSREAVEVLSKFDGDKMVFPRMQAVLDEDGDLCMDPDVLKEYGAEGVEDRIGKIFGAGFGIFVLKREHWERLGGYHPRFGGKYGGDDVDINHRYGDLVKQGLATRHTVGPPMYCYPNPRYDKKAVFHTLRRRWTRYKIPQEPMPF